MDETDQQPEIDERLADLRRRRAEAADVLAESLLDLWLRQRRAKREGRPWPPPDWLPPFPEPPKPPKVPKPKPERMRPPAMIRTYRDADEADLEGVVPLLAPLGVTRAELAEPVNRMFVVQEHKGQFTGVGVLDRHGPVGVLRGLVVEPKARLVTHGSYLAIHLLKRAHVDRLLHVYALGVVPQFLERLGFTALERAEVPGLVRSLPGLAGATLPLFEVRPRPDGAKRPNSRHYPKTLTELLTAPGPRSTR
jgi:N-acetylglutamate synthase-like GNAT family acetyltransferase